MIFTAVYVVVVFAIFTHVVPPSIEDSQRITLPILPAKVNVVELLPAQAIVVAGLMVPPCDKVVIVNVAAPPEIVKFDTRVALPVPPPYSAVPQNEPTIVGSGQTVL